MHSRLIVAAALAFGAAAPAAPADPFQNLVDRFFQEAYFRFNPAQATSAGFHQYDQKLETFAQPEIHAQVNVLLRYRAAFEAVNPRGLPAADASDRELAIASIQGALLGLETIRMWEKNPDQYSSTLTNGVYTIMSRKFAPAAERLRSVIARERQAPRLFAEARDNLRHPPRVYTEVALQQLPGMIEFFRRDVPQAFAEVRDAALLAEFRSANQAVMDALAAYQKFLHDDLLPRSNGDFRIGAENYRKKLLYDEMVDTPLDRLLEIGMADLRRNQQTLRQTAARIDPHGAPWQILADLERDHPAPDRLLASFRDVLGGLREFITAHHIVTIPSPVAPIVEETPPFMRALTSASMDTPGPYEQVAKEAYFNITLPEKGWTGRQVEEFMEDFNRGTIMSTAIHEAYPGHYVQFLWLERAPSKVRKLLGAGSNAEGWAHYCEQMMLDEGFGNGDPKLRLGQLQDALLRDARYIAGIEMHTGRMTFDQAVDFFVNEGYQTREVAVRETRRGTADPTYLVYTLGKLEILKLRDDYRRLKGPQFRLQEFHDRFLAQGYPPIRLVRRALLGTDSPVL